MEELSPSIQHAKVFHLAGRILEWKASLSSLTVVQATVDIPITKDLEEGAKLWARLALKAMASFDAHASDDRDPTTSYYSPKFAGASYLFNTVARFSLKHQGIRSGVVCIVNDTDILVFSRAGGNTIQVVLQCDDGFEGTTNYDGQKTCP